MDILKKLEYADYLGGHVIKNSEKAAQSIRRYGTKMTVRIKTAADESGTRVTGLRSYVIPFQNAAREYTAPIMRFIAQKSISLHKAYALLKRILPKIEKPVPRKMSPLEPDPRLPDFTECVVCVRSFFDGHLTRVSKARRGWTVATASLCAALLMSTAAVNSLFTFNLYVDGREIGETATIFEVDEIVAGAEVRLEEILGYEYSLDSSLSVAASIKKTQIESEDLEKALVSSVEGVEEKYTLVVHGEVVGAVDEEEVLTDLLDDVLSEYSTDASDSVRFVDEVEVVKQFVTPEVFKEPEEILTLITPANEESQFKLAVENIESALISEEIPYEVEYVEDPNMYEGETMVLEEGESGAALVTERLVLLNGVEQSRENAGRVVTKEPTKEVVAVGVAKRPKTMSTGEYIWPAEGIISSKYGSRQTSVGSSNHKGLDIAGKKGSPIVASDGGEVVFSGWKNAYGYVVIIRHDNGYETVYGHNSALLVSVGERVYQGQEIALMGSTGLSTGVHCHFEIRIDGDYSDPLPFLS